MSHQRNRPSWQTRTLAGFVCLFVVFTNPGMVKVSFGQSPADVNQWKQTQLKTLGIQMKATNSPALLRELNARQRWLQRWEPGQMKSKPNSAAPVPKPRKEPILRSAVADQLRKELDSKKKVETDANISDWLKQATLDHPQDLAVMQLRLHWLDEIVRRKQNLDAIEELSNRLADGLGKKARTSEHDDLAEQFVLYRRVRALAYRELPDVVARRPIKDQAQLNTRIQTVFDSLLKKAGQGRTEFILIEVRMYRRATRQGTALDLLERYGATLSLKWYLKKRRDLLEELKWDIPHQEAAVIYATEFPNEVAKETRPIAQALGYFLVFSFEISIGVSSRFAHSAIESS